MTDDKQIVTFDLNELEVIQSKSGGISVTPTAEKLIIRWLEFKEKFEQIEQTIKDRIKSEMENNNCIAIDSNELRITRRFFGDKYELTNPEQAFEDGFADVETKMKVNSKEVDKYVKENGDTPNGVGLKTRTMSVVISKKNNDK